LDSIHAALDQRGCCVGDVHAGDGGILGRQPGRDAGVGDGQLGSVPGGTEFFIFFAQIGGQEAIVVIQAIHIEILGLIQRIARAAQYDVLVEIDVEVGWSAFAFEYGDSGEIHAGAGGLEHSGVPVFSERIRAVVAGGGDGQGEVASDKDGGIDGLHGFGVFNDGRAVNLRPYFGVFGVMTPILRSGDGAEVEIGFGRAALVIFARVIGVGAESVRLAVVSVIPGLEADGPELNADGIEMLDAQRVVAIIGGQRTAGADAGPI